jgi:hypothetical protein
MKRQRIASDSYDGFLGMLNAFLISLPFWGLIYFGLRILHLLK